MGFSLSLFENDLLSSEQELVKVTSFWGRWHFFLLAVMMGNAFKNDAASYSSSSSNNNNNDQNQSSDPDARLLHLPINKISSLHHL